MISWYWVIIAFLLGIVFATVTWHAVEWAKNKPTLKIYY